MDFKQAQCILRRHSHHLAKTVEKFSGVMIAKDEDSGRLKMQILVEKELDSHKKFKKMKAGRLKLKPESEPLADEDLVIEVKAVGRIKALLERTDKWFPQPSAPGGVSIGHELLMRAGTLSCSVFKGCTRYILSNNHVIANQVGTAPPYDDDAHVGDYIYQPGPGDGGTPEANRIGILVSFKRIKFNEIGDCPNNLVDAALCLPYSDDYITNELLADTPPNFSTRGKRNWVLGEAVEKSGKTSGITTGIILGWADIVVWYGVEKWAYFEHQIITDVMLADGDSGSLLVNAATHQVVGLGFAGNDYISVHNDACYVAETFGITFYPTKGITLAAHPRVPARSSLNKIASKLVDGLRKIAGIFCPCYDPCPQVYECCSPLPTPKYITVSFNEIEKISECCPPEWPVTKYLFEPNKSFILEQSEVDSCYWEYEEEVDWRHYYSDKPCIGTEEVFRGVITVSVYRYSQNRLVVGYGCESDLVDIFQNLLVTPIAGCVNASAANIDQGEVSCLNQYSKGTAIIGEAGIS